MQYINMTIHLDRLEVANKVLKTIGNKTYEFIVEQNKLYLSWGTESRFYKKLCRLQAGSHYFYAYSFRHNLGTGGTGESAIVQLVRWVKGKNTLPLGQWRYWASPSVKLWQDDAVAKQVLEWLTEAGYPIEPICIFCGKKISSYDWWSLPNQKEGLGCWEGSDCPNYPNKK
jgi:hypothetical protein